ncbi:MAG: hypothetical protein H8E47_05490 [Anaerolineales bacterium]|nr:hypothetical protein [Anaerolineales bacterium]
MMTPDQIGVYTPVSEIFPDVQSDFETFKSLLHGLSRTDTLFWCARLNLVISHSSDVDHLTRQQFGLNQFLMAEEINAVNDFARRHGGPQRVMFFRGQLLELLRWVVLYCHDHPGDGMTFENPEVRRRFAQAALLASDIWAKRVFENKFSLDGGVDIARERALGPIRKSIEATSSAPDLSKSLGRGWTLFRDYFPRYYQCFEEEFRSSTGLSVEEYYICLGAMITNFMNPRIGAGIFDSNLLGESTPYRGVLQKYITLESQTADELRDALWGQVKRDANNDQDAPPYDYRALREKPILRAGDGRAIILDPVFYSEKASIGPLFLLTKKKSGDEANEIFGAFGNAFESYACDILKRMFPDISGVLTKRLSCNIHGTDQAGNEIEIDACLNDVTEIVLFEMKAVWIREDEILTEDYERYLQHLRKKYGVARGASRDRRSKGVGQIARTIRLLASREWLGQNKEFSETQLIYPVLVVHDPFLAAPVYGNSLASEFKTLLTPDAELRSGELKKGQIRIAPLIVMTVENLEDLETSIEHFGFRDLLADYTRSCPDRLMSLHNFIAFSEYGQQMRHNRSIAAKGLELLGKSQEAIFLTDSCTG